MEALEASPSEEAEGGDWGVGEGEGWWRGEERGGHVVPGWEWTLLNLSTIFARHDLLLLSLLEHSVEGVVEKEEDEL